MTDKEKQAIEYWKRELHHYEYTKDLDLASKNYFGQFEEKINMISEILNLVKSQTKELEKKDKVINEMAKWIHNKGTDETEICDYEKCIKYTTRKKPLGDCIMCIKEYFERKVEEDGNKNTEIG